MSAGPRRRGRACDPWGCYALLHHGKCTSSFGHGRRRNFLFGQLLSEGGSPQPHALRGIQLRLEREDASPRRFLLTVSRQPLLPLPPPQRAQVAVKVGRNCLPRIQAVVSPNRFRLLASWRRTVLAHKRGPSQWNDGVGGDYIGGNSTRIAKW